MLLQVKDNISVAKFYMEYGVRDFLGFLPVIDPDNHSYYTVANDHPERIYERVSPVFGEYNNDIVSELESWYSQETLPKWTREEQKLEHEFYRGEVLERLERCKYCIWFVGCDDGDKFMRFESKESALEFLNNITAFDFVDEHPLCQYWH